MANTYRQLYIQLVFAVRDRESLMQSSWEEELYKYITGIVQKHNHKMLAINGMSDHIHIFIGYNPNHLLPDLVKQIKTASNEFVKQKKFTRHYFSWQGGYGAFSYSHSHIDRVIKYVMNQKEHHKKQSFKEEYLMMLDKFEVDYNERYLFEWIE